MKRVWTGAGERTRFKSIQTRLAPIVAASTPPQQPPCGAVTGEGAGATGENLRGTVPPEHGVIHILGRRALPCAQSGTLGFTEKGIDHIITMTPRAAGASQLS